LRAPYLLSAEDLWYEKTFHFRNPLKRDPLLLLLPALLAECASW
jgi:hypothetical protein